MTTKELKQLVALGEGVNLEFKHRVPQGERIAKEVIALANTKGGRILLGVSDDGTVVGVDDAGEEEFLLHRAVEMHCRPAVPYTTERIVIAGERDVILVSVPESEDKPHHLVTDTTAPASGNGAASAGTAYVRVEEMSVEASPESLQMMQADGQASGAAFTYGENESLAMRYLDDYGHITVEQFARIADLSTEEATDTLVGLAQANILRLHADREEDYFTLAY
jgi:predicted HTH transcriptional regulator